MSNNNDTGIWVYDIETLSNCFTYTAINRETEEIKKYVIWNNINQLNSLLNHLWFECKGMIGFNNLDFDYPVLHYILKKHSDWETKTGSEISKLIYDKAQEVIFQKWSGIKNKLIRIPQLDLFKIWHYDNKARMTSLKKLQIALQYHNVQDMPYKHYDTIENRSQVKEILDYNLNDVRSTLDFYKKTIPKLELRKGLYKRYGLRCINYPDSKIGEELTLRLYCNETGEQYEKIKKRRTNRKLFKFKNCFPDYLDFETDEFKALENYLSSIEVTELKGSFKYSFDYQGFTFDLGTGGIHGCIKSGVYNQTDTHIIIDVDVASLYPSLAIANNFYPEHLGEIFITVYNDGIVKPRLKAKKEGDKIMNLGFKLSANAVYGKSNSEYSWLYDPLYTLKTTLAGQLSLCMLSEQLMTQVDDMTMLQINTDGLTAIVPKTEKDNFYKICKDWENQTGLVLEYQSYLKMIIRDVNSYIAQSLDGNLKLKGAFKRYEDMIRDEEYHKSLSQTIVPHAICEYFINNTPVEQTIVQSNNIYDFCKTFNASHGWTCEIVDKHNNITQMQKTNRYFVSNDGYLFRKNKDVRTIEIEAGGKLVTIFNKFEKKNNILDYNINYEYYINECYKIIHKIDGTEEELKRLKKLKIGKNQLSLFNPN